MFTLAAWQSLWREGAGPAAVTHILSIRTNNVKNSAHELLISRHINTMFRLKRLLRFPHSRISKDPFGRDLQSFIQPTGWHVSFKSLCSLQALFSVCEFLWSQCSAWKLLGRSWSRASCTPWATWGYRLTTKGVGENLLILKNPNTVGYMTCRRKPTFNSLQRLQLPFVPDVFSAASKCINWTFAFKTYSNESMQV